METKRYQETNQIRRLFLFAFVLNLILAGVKTILAVISNSFAVTAGAIDSVTDSVASLAVYVGILISTRSTKSFPLGLYKVENVLSIGIALFIFLTGYEVARQVFLAPKALPSFSFSTLLILSVATAAIFLFGYYASSVGRQTGSPTLIAEGKHRQVDVLANLAVLLAVFSQYCGLHFSIMGLSIDQLAAIMVLVFVIYTGWELLLDGMRVLLDASVDHDTLTKIRNIMHDEPTVVEVKKLIGRSAGRFLFIQAEIVLRVKDLKNAHLVSDSLEKLIMQEIRNVEQIIIHYEPHVPQILCFAFPLQDKHGKLSEHFGGAPYFALLEYSLQTQLVGKKEILSNPYREIERGKGLRVAEWLVSQKIDHIIMKESIARKAPEYVLSDAGVKIDYTPFDALDQIPLSEQVEISNTSENENRMLPLQY